MNKIEVKLGKTPYVVNEHLMIYIDYSPLHEIISTHIDEEHYDGLVSTLLNGWMNDKLEEKIVQDRLISTDNIKVNLPILMCPDDCDFSCSIISAEMIKTKKLIYWNKFGVDISPAPELYPNIKATEIQWIHNSPKFTFDRSQFEKEIAKFREG